MRTEEERTVVDLLASGPERSTVEQRIERRLEVLRMWLADGVPFGQEAPKNLATARRWEEHSLQIAAIASPNDFTQNHPRFGERVREIARLLTAIHKRYGAPSGTTRGPATPPTAAFDRRAHERQLEKLVTQWHAERDRSLAEKVRADASEARSVMLLDENAHKDKLIADLRRQLAERQGLRVV